MYFNFSICESFCFLYFISFIWFALFYVSKASFQKCIFDPTLQEQIRIEGMRNIVLSKLDISLSLIQNPPPSISLDEFDHAREEYIIAKRITDLENMDSLNCSQSAFPLPRIFVLEKLRIFKLCDSLENKLTFFIIPYTVNRDLQSLLSAELKLFKSTFNPRVFTNSSLIFSVLECQNGDPYLTLGEAMLANIILSNPLIIFDDDVLIDVTSYAEGGRLLFCGFKVDIYFNFIDNYTCLSNFPLKNFQLFSIYRKAESKRDIRQSLQNVNCRSIDNNCCTHPLNLNFADPLINLDHIIIYPPFITINYCSGICPLIFSSSSTQPVLNRYYVNQLNPHGSSSPCCVPIQFSSAVVEVYTPNGEIIANTLDNIIVFNCECR